MVLLRLTVKVVPRAVEGEEAKDADGLKSTSFLMVVHRPDQMSLGELAWRVSEQWKKLRPDAEPLVIKKLLDDNHDTDELDADLTVADVFIDYGKARADGLDQRGALRVIQQPTSTRSVRYGSVVQDWDAITNHHSRRAPRLSRRQLAHFPVASGLASASPVKNHLAAVNGGGIPFEVAESVYPLGSIEEEPAATASHQRREPSPALAERELTQETTDTNASNLRSSPLDAFPSSTRLPRHHRAQLGKDGDMLIPGVHTSLLSNQAALRNSKEAKPSQLAISGRPSPTAARQPKRPRTADSEELSGNTSSLATSQRHPKHAKRQKIAETPASELEPEDDEMLDAHPPRASTGKSQVLPYVHKGKTDARQNSQKALREDPNGAPAVIDLTCTLCTTESNSKPKSNQIGLGITASPPKKRTVDKLDIHKDNSGALLTPKASGRPNRPRSSDPHQIFPDLTQDAPSSARLANNKKAVSSRDAKADARKKTTMQSGKAYSRDFNSGTAVHGKWTDKFDCRVAGYNRERAISHLNDLVQAAKEADDSQGQIRRLEKMAKELKKLPNYAGKGTEAIQVRKNAHRRINRLLETLEVMGQPRLSREEPQHHEDEVDEESSGEENEPRSGRSSSTKNDSEKEVDEKSTAAKSTAVNTDKKKDASDGNGSESERVHSNEENDEGRSDSEDGSEKDDEEDEEEKQDRTRLRVCVSPSLSDVGDERLSATGPRRSSKGTVRDKSPSVYSVPLSGSEAPDPESDKSESGSKSGSEGDEEDDESTPRAKVVSKKTPSQESSAASESNELESVGKGNASESIATTPSEKDTDIKPNGTRQDKVEREETEKSGRSSEEKEASESDEDGEEGKDEKFEDAKEGSESDEESDSAGEEAAAPNADASKIPAAKKQVTVFEDSDSGSSSESSSASEGSDIQYRKPKPKDDGTEAAQQPATEQDMQNKLPTAPTPRKKKVHVLKRSQTPLHRPFQPWQDSAHNKTNPASSPLVEDKSNRPEFITFSQPAPTATRRSSAVANGTRPQSTPTGSNPERSSNGLKRLLKGKSTRNMFGKPSSPAI
ncbi:TPA_exp: Conserved serine-rich protein [Trichophyton benhamiae CBS 112371]|uniref:Conserved serine-rich protein n=1 Tax=Arthroderma benhamiae (strain ATCC MYA-4681 / CBS 112371) TaxID=663331 RepID=D4ASD4_ARTBC|nr:conserved serine-rich protein [Trichophyton benhamiae CBS 112371]EFE34198.1 conserved serine-rich protein [Trichophyton benhamiae CBS 112371]DAA77162.1 TPA_exp: Conserved serine-rich protein [Trichophyton benhamiae CBS 112371]